MTRRTRRLVPLTALTAVAALLFAGCAGDADTTPQAGEDEQQDAPDTDEPDDEPDSDDPNGSDGEIDEVDEEEAIAEAEELLGLPEDEIEEDERTRVIRRGDEEYERTMDLQPGRRNLELDDDGTGTYVVTRVVIETSGEDIVVE